MTTTATGEPQAGEPKSGQEPQTAAGATATPQAGEGTEGSPAPTVTPEFAALQRELADVRKEAASSRKKLKDRDDADEAAKQAALSETERITAERDALKAKEAEWQAEKRRLLADAEARDLGTKLGLVDHRDALALIPPDQIAIDDTTGRPTNLEQLFRDLVKEKPYLAAKPGAPTPPSTGAAAGTSGGPAPRLTSDELEAARQGGLTPERYAALKNVKTLEEWRATKPAAT